MIERIKNFCVWFLGYKLQEMLTFAIVLEGILCCRDVSRIPITNSCSK